MVTNVMYYITLRCDVKGGGGGGGGVETKRQRRNGSKIVQDSIAWGSVEILSPFL